MTCFLSYAIENKKVRERLAKVLCWHVTHEQAALSDHDLVMYAVNEHLKHMGRPLIDPNE